MVYGGYMGNMYICIGVYPYPTGLATTLGLNETGSIFEVLPRVLLVETLFQM